MPHVLFIIGGIGLQKIRPLNIHPLVPPGNWSASLPMRPAKVLDAIALPKQSTVTSPNARAAICALDRNGSGSTISVRRSGRAIPMSGVVMPSGRWHGASRLCRSCLKLEQLEPYNSGATLAMPVRRASQHWLVRALVRERRLMLTGSFQRKRGLALSIHSLTGGHIASKVITYGDFHSHVSAGEIISPSGSWSEIANYACPGDLSILSENMPPE